MGETPLGATLSLWEKTALAPQRTALAIQTKPTDLGFKFLESAQVVTEPVVPLRGSKLRAASRREVRMRVCVAAFALQPFGHPTAGVPEALF